MADKADWKQLVQGSGQLTDRNENLLSRVKELEGHNSVLEEKLKAAEVEILSLRRKLASPEEQGKIEEKDLSTVKELHSSVTRLLKEAEVLALFKEPR